MFRTVPLSIIRSFSLYTQHCFMSYRFVDSLRAGSGWKWFGSAVAVNKPVWHTPLLCVQWKAPDDGQRNCPKHVEFYSENKFEKWVHLVGFIIRIYHDSRSSERLIGFYNWNGVFYCVIRAESLHVIWLIFLYRVNPVLENAWAILSASPLSADDTSHITEV